MTDFGDFDLDRSTGEAWTAFTDRLDEVLAVMDASADLNISVASSGPTGQPSPAVRFSVVRPETVRATLRDAALADDQASRLEQLGWSANGGEWSAERDQEHSLELAQLVSTTMSDVLGVLHPVFLEPDQLAEILMPLEASTDPTPVSAEALGIVMPQTQAQLDAIVDEELGGIYGHPPLRNPDGDVAIRVGSTVVFLRSTPDYRELVLFAALVHDVAGRSRACEVLNDLNMESRYCRFALHRDRVFVQISVPTQPFVPAHLRQALESISHVADAIDDELANRLGGHTTFPPNP